jgi:hypothetical protein
MFKLQIFAFIHVSRVSFYKRPHNSKSLPQSLCADGFFNLKKIVNFYFFALT